MRPDGREPLLASLPPGFRTELVAMRWLRFLLENIEVEALPSLMAYYARIGWIGKDVEQAMVERVQGTLAPAESEYVEDLDEDEIEAHELVLAKKPSGGKKAKVEEVAMGWQLSPEDHIKSLMFIMELRGEPVEKNELLELEQRIDRFESDMEEYYRV